MAHAALQAGNSAVITGGADGIGYAAAQHFLGLGMRVLVADIDEERLASCAQEHPALLTHPCDVSSLASVEALAAAARDAFGEVHVLMNNAGTARPCNAIEGHQAWRETLEINLWGVINGIHAFVPAMLEHGKPGLVVNTGSKQGITSPPGNPAYNVSKAAIKSATEALQHDLRNLPDCQLSAHLLVPGFTYTGMIRQFLPEKPEGAWMPSQVVEFLCDAVERGDFYVICPDNDVTREVDNKRMLWAMQDITENRPPLSRWHPDYEAAFAAYLSG